MAHKHMNVVVPDDHAIYLCRHDKQAFFIYLADNTSTRVLSIIISNISCFCCSHCHLLQKICILIIQSNNTIYYKLINRMNVEIMINLSHDYYWPIASWISRDTFNEIRRYLHFPHNSMLVPLGSNRYDHLSKVRQS